jgi:hypothetical protein
LPSPGPEIQRVLFDKYNLEVEAWVLRRTLEKIGCVWGKSNNVQEVNPNDPRVVAQKRQFIIEYAECLRQQREGRILLVYSDETAVHTTLSQDYGWLLPDEGETEINYKKFKGPKKGTRLTCAHATSIDGLLDGTDCKEQGERVQIDGIPKEPVANAELLVQGKDCEDYHNSLDGSAYRDYVDRRVFPAFYKKRRHSKVAMVFVIDRASVHAAHEPGWENPRTIAKYKAAELLSEKYKVEEISAARTDIKNIAHAVTFKKDTWGTRAPNGPSQTGNAEKVDAKNRIFF